MNKILFIAILMAIYASGTTSLFAEEALPPLQKVGQGALPPEQWGEITLPEESVQEAPPLEEWGDLPPLEEGVDEDGHTVWTCSMHPNIQLPEFGQCPICFMDLIEVAVDSGSLKSLRQA